MKPSLRAFLFLSITAILVSGCTKLYTKQELNPLERFRRSTINALTSEQPNEDTLQQLRILFLEQDWKGNPEYVLGRLEEEIQNKGKNELIPTLAELLFLRARKLEQSDQSKATAYYVATAAYCYTFLFKNVDPLSHSFVAPLGRFMTVLYNASVSRFITLETSIANDWNNAKTFEALGNRYTISLKRSGENLWDPHYFDKFLPAYETEVKGLSNYYRLSGIGAPFASIRENDPNSPDSDPFFSSRMVFPTTALLRFTESEDHDDKVLHRASIEFIDSIESETVTINDRDYPLEADLTTTFGVLLAKTKVGRNSFDALRRPGRYIEKAGIYLTEPYDPRKIPVILVHGINSSPATFVEMYNDFLGIKKLRHRFQFWFFQYPTGLPNLFSSMLLRESIKDIRQHFDSEKTNPNFQQMVVIGHSMGGLLSKTLIQEPGSILWDSTFKVDLTELNLDEEEKDAAEKMLLYHPTPFVTRVVFIATPHRGAAIANSFIVRRAKKLISIPSDLERSLTSALRSNQSSLQNKELANLTRPSTSVDNLNPSSKYLNKSLSIPLDPSVPFHSIIAIRNAKEGPGSNDGVITYESAHLPGAASETLVPAGHSCLRHPLTIAEVERILLLHLEDIEASHQ